MMNSLKTYWSNLPVRNKWIVLVTSIFIVFLLAFKFNISKAYQEICKYNQVNNNHLLIRHTNTASNKHSQIDSVLNFENNLYVLNYISSFCTTQSIYINEISQTNNEKRDGLTVETTKLVLSGKYSAILNMIYNIESQARIARVNSVSFNLAKYKNNKEFSLLATVYIKYIRK